MKFDAGLNLGKTLPDVDVCSCRQPPAAVCLASLRSEGKEDGGLLVSCVGYFLLAGPVARDWAL